LEVCDGLYSTLCERDYVIHVKGTLFVTTMLALQDGGESAEEIKDSPPAAWLWL
jgi:hypothetical protein